MNFHEHFLEVFNFGTSLGRLVRLIWLIGFVGLVRLLPGLCLVHGHADVESCDHLGPDVCAGGAEEGHVAGLEVEAGEVCQLLQHLTGLGLVRLAWLVGLTGLVGFVGLNTQMKQKKSMLMSFTFCAATKARHATNTNLFILVIDFFLKRSNNLTV